MKIVKKNCIYIIPTLFVVYISLHAQMSDPIDFWAHPKKGANIFNRQITRDDIRAARHFGIQFVRIAPDKFISHHRDFLLGNTDDYHGLAKDDLRTLINILDICTQESMPVVLTMLSIPYSRWKQNNNDIDDLAIWSHPDGFSKAAQFWHDLAIALKNHPAIVAYNILNEPHPEKICSSPLKDPIALLATFNIAIIEAISAVDPMVPIIIDSGNYGNPQAFEYMVPPSTDTRIIYSFHMYEPYDYTNKQRNNGRYTYPGCSIDNAVWNKSALSRYVQPVADFQKKYNVPACRIMVGEFGGHKASPGLEHYFQDLIDIFEHNNWHYAFYSFNEDTWDGMDYHNSPAGNVLKATYFCET